VVVFVLDSDVSAELDVKVVYTDDGVDKEIVLLLS